MLIFIRTTHNYIRFATGGFQEGFNGSKDARRCIRFLMEGERYYPYPSYCDIPLSRPLDFCRAHTRSSPQKLLQADFNFTAGESERILQGTVGEGMTKNWDY